MTTQPVVPSTTRRARSRFAALLVAALAVVIAVPATAAPASAATTGFRDVTNHYQFYREISWLTEKGITTGYADKSFRPEQEVSREAFAAFLYRLAGRPGVSVPSRSPFKDVDTSDQFYREIVWLEKQNITTGWADGTFRPKEAISRSAMAAFLYRYKGSPSYSPPSSSRFKDMRTSSKFYKEVSWLATTGMTTGYADGTFRPYDGTSRAATAAFLFRGFGSSSYQAPTYVAPEVNWRPSEILSTARSQVGYREPSWRDNKFNDWIGGSSAWCSVYVSWVFEAAGYPGYVPREKYFNSTYTSSGSTFVGKLQSAGVLDWNPSLSDLKPGYVVLINWGDGKGASHAAIVDRVSGNGAWFYEGNTTSGTGDKTRGVFHRWRSASVIDAVFDPRDYYDATH
ncbi:S-layer homology domain-containing protein [Demequina sp. NBRC 110051]|uniref:S-layer homology domain-containing protein n=1 Tax=Demequina sp. NBRC 110051 TaxID=1570340 RepID=UPI0009FC5846|nr:S-layer homology domain-containing protein [Demequina sp. NBRC 110051]